MPSKKFKITQSDLVDYKVKQMARKQVTKMLKTGELVRADTCQLCKLKKKTEAHHCDYGQPANVVWLCDKCHGLAHREGHPLNPDLIPQTEVKVVWNERDNMTISVKIPIENFILLKKIAEKKGTHVSKMVRGCVLEKYAVEDNQLEFKLFEDSQDEHDKNLQKRVSLLEYNQERLHKQKSQQVFPLWVEGVDLGERVERLPDFFKGYGTDAAKCGWVGIARQG